MVNIFTRRFQLWFTLETFKNPDTCLDRMAKTKKYLSFYLYRINIFGVNVDIPVDSVSFSLSLSPCVVLKHEVTALNNSWSQKLECFLASFL